MILPQDTNLIRTMSGVQACSYSLHPKYPSGFRPLLIVYRVSALNTMKVQGGSGQMICVDESTYS